MTPAQREAIFAYDVSHYDGNKDPQWFLDLFEVQDGNQLSLRLLSDAVSKGLSDDFEAAVSVCWAFGFTKRHLASLHLASYADWHKRHEEIVAALDEIRSSTSLPSLMHLATWIPEYLGWDQNRALMRNAVWAIGKLEPPKDIDAALNTLSHSVDARVVEAAERQLRRRLGD